MELNNSGFSPESLRLIGAALALQQATRTAANIVPLPGTGRFVVVGTPAEVARLMEIAPQTAPNPPQSQAALDVLAERQRQVEQEGWMPAHDDQYQGGELAIAAACYALAGDPPDFGAPNEWPWALEWWKPGDDRRNLVKAGALILADIERIDRLAQKIHGKTLTCWSCRETYTERDRAESDGHCPKCGVEIEHDHSEGGHHD